MSSLDISIQNCLKILNAKTLIPLLRDTGNAQISCVGTKRF